MTFRGFVCVVIAAFVTLPALGQEPEAERDEAAPPLRELQAGTGGDPLAGALAMAVSLVAAQVQAVGALASDPGTRLVRKTIEDRRHGLLLGPRHRRFEEDQQRRAEIQKREPKGAGW